MPGAPARSLAITALADHTALVIRMDTDMAGAPVAAIILTAIINRADWSGATEDGSSEPPSRLGQW